MNRIIFLLTICVATLAVAADKFQLRDSVAATGNYLFVSQPLLQISNNPPRDSVARYMLWLLTQSDSDSLVAFTSQQYLWVLNDGDSTEQAFFNRSNPTDTTTPPVSFHEAIMTFMANRNISGQIIETGQNANEEWAFVNRVDSLTDSTVVVQSAWITRTDDTLWAIRIIE